MKKSAVQELMEFWELLHVRYQETPSLYKQSLQERRILNRKLCQEQKTGISLRRLPKEVLATYPTIYFLTIQTAVEAQNYLENLQDNEYPGIKQQVESFEYHYSYRSMRAFIIDTNALLRKDRHPINTNINPAYIKNFSLHLYSRH